ncbi:MAG TPA: sulfite exporter TauE/SafE family protein [Propionibacterium sp.]|nr:sulfite exporter TauE/SafE family protein [Propionibacterium sp.]
MNLVGAIAVGLVIGVVLGTLGGGGAILTIPVLTYAFGMGIRESTTASLVIVGVSSLTAVAVHARAGRVDWVRGLVFAAFGMGGAVLGSILSRGLDPDWLMAGFAVLLALVAGLMLRPSRKKLGDGPAKLTPKVAVLTALTGLGVGVLTGFFGVGGGFAIVPALTLVLGLPMAVAVATSLLVISLNSASALVTKLALGIALEWVFIGVFTTATIIGSLFGARLAGRLDAAVLKRAFAWLLVAVSAYMLVTSAITLFG